jgi:hypothetical protein
VKILIAGAALLGAGCIPHPQSTPVPPEDAACNAAAAQELVGRVGSPALAGEAQRLAGAGTVRFLRPGQIVTMEYRADRLNLHVGADNRVERIVCG